MKRYLGGPIQTLVEEKFLLVSGPRQVGKTTLAKQWLETHKGLYLNWDIPPDREKILTFFKSALAAHCLVFDEIHKYARWKSWVKGLWDQHGKELKVIVTGSARLDLFQRSGDSLLGRYNLLRLHPFSVGELTHGTIPPPPQKSQNWALIGGQKVKQSDWERLKRRGGFPEPFLKDEDLHHRRWALRRRQLLIQEDLKDLTDIRNLSLIEHLALLLPGRVGSPLSVNALREEIQTAHDTLSAWLDALERIYFSFRLLPYSLKIARSLKKERKLYLWDWSVLEDPGIRFENMVASHLLKAVHVWTDLGYGDFDLLYWRDKQKREVDFVITKDRKPVALFECHLNQERLSPALAYLGSGLGEVAQVQLVDKPGVDFSKGNVRVVNAATYLAALP